MLVPWSPDAGGADGGGAGTVGAQEAPQVLGGADALGWWLVILRTPRAPERGFTPGLCPPGR
ncbi:MAG: hypothetical protein ACRDNJ_13985 [Solirubrobacteraceae bacterium]